MSVCVASACAVGAHYKCTRCGAPYCSPTCQKKDWVHHRSQCKPKPVVIAGNNKVMSLGALADMRMDVKQTTCFFNFYDSHGDLLQRLILDHKAAWLATVSPRKIFLINMMPSKLVLSGSQARHARRESYVHYPNLNLHLKALPPTGVYEWTNPLIRSLHQDAQFVKEVNAAATQPDKFFTFCWVARDLYQCGVVQAPWSTDSYGQCLETMMEPRCCPR